MTEISCLGVLETRYLKRRILKIKKGNINIKVQSQKLDSEDWQSNTSQEVGGGSSWLFSATLSFLKLSCLDVDVLADVTHYVGYLLFKSMGDPTFAGLP